MVIFSSLQLTCVRFSSWQNDVFVVAEPGELADKFVQSVKMSLLSSMESRRRKGISFLTNMSTVADLVSSTRQFQMGCIIHRYIGCQTQVKFPFLLSVKHIYMVMIRMGMYGSVSFCALF